MLRSAKARATKAGVPFALTERDIIIPHTCPALGIPIRVGNIQATDNSPSLDRVVPSLGYVPGNIVVISNRANRIKNNATVPELEAIARYYREFIANGWLLKP